jgi:penicillin-binding protein 1A
MNKAKAFLLAILVISFAIIAVILIYFSYKTILLSRLSKNIELKSIKYNDDVKLKIYSKNKTLIYDNQFRWAGKINDEDLNSLLIKATTILSKNKTKIKDLEKYFSKIYHIDADLLQSKLLRDYATPTIKKTDNLNEFEKELTTCFAVKNILKENTVKEIYLNYLNNIAFGKNIFGINGASKYYFGKNFNNLNLKEQLFLISIAINKVTPEMKISPKLKRQIDRIIWELYQAGKINKNKLQNCLATIIKINKNKIFILDIPTSNAILYELRKRNFDYKNHSYNVYSTLDLKLQNKIKNILKKETYKINKHLQAAFVVIDYNRANGIAIVGSKNNKDKKNRAFFMKRQIGSIFKPIVYLAAFSSGYKPTDLLEDKQYIFKKNGIVYKPSNFEDFFMGKTKIQNGLIFSLNNLTVKLATKVGLNTVAKLAVNMGFREAKPYLAMPLGSIPFTPYQVAASYTSLANYGIKKDITLLKNVIDLKTNKNILNLEHPKRIINKKACTQVLNLMKRVVRYGTARGKHLLKGTAGKTGTTNNYKDAWFLAIYKPYVTVCWVGYDNYKSMGEDGTGGHMAAPITAKIQRILLRYNKHKK